MEPQPRRRRRPALSCIECRRRKVKCDRNNPCAHCVAAKSPCRYRSYGCHEGAVRQPLQVATQNRLAPISPAADGAASSPELLAGWTPELRVTGSVEPKAAPAVAATPASTSHSSYQSLLQRHEPLQGFHGLLNCMTERNVSSSAATPSISRPSENNPTHQVELPGFSATMYKGRILTSSHRIGVTHELATIYECWSKAFSDSGETPFADEEARAIAAQVRDLAQRCKLLSKTMKLERPSIFLSWNDFQLELPSREESDTMASLYFQFFESSFRVLHRPTFWADYQKYWEEPGSLAIEARLKILLVVAAGSSVYESSAKQHLRLRKIGFRWVFAAHTWLSSPTEKDRLTMTGLQIHCLTILVRQNLNIGGDLIWDSASSLLHRSMQLDSALPPRIAIGDYDTEPPSNINDEELSEGSTNTRSHPSHVFTDTSIQRVLLESLPSRLRTVQLLNGLKVQVSYEDILSLSREIKGQLRDISKFLNSFRKDRLTTFHRNLLDFLVRRFLVLLHSSFATKARTDPMYHYSLTTTVEASLALIHPEPDETYARLIARGGGSYREGMMCAKMTIGVELISQTEARRQDGTLRRTPNTRELLKEAVKKSLWLAFERIQQQAETSIKGPLFAGMILAQVQAIEDEVDEHVKILSCAKESLERLQSLLQTLIDASALPCPSEDVDWAASASEPGMEDFVFGWGLDFLTSEWN
ncbi:hypothetical protein S7711_06839 [Stachybotrys chartarum IBT 7711]|uniref:Zn(2)-C6 fungal-type domain-containing protein n=1 Tax=Stachybotrys chartarum (strain CBS 109288 / IBT 7711) TaxID=1280523 RepID=A0A084B791_STACB|nr:hypothetical protein S7711_06839 [Stachybotrys chartarum IBT 7711]